MKEPIPPQKKIAVSKRWQKSGPGSIVEGTRSDPEPADQAMLKTIPEAAVQKMPSHEELLAETTKSICAATGVTNWELGAWFLDQAQKWFANDDAGLKDALALMTAMKCSRIPEQSTYLRPAMRGHGSEPEPSHEPDTQRAVFLELG